LGLIDDHLCMSLDLRVLARLVVEILGSA